MIVVSTITRFTLAALITPARFAASIVSADSSSTPASAQLLAPSRQPRRVDRSILTAIRCSQAKRTCRRRQYAFDLSGAPVDRQDLSGYSPLRRRHSAPHRPLSRARAFVRMSAKHRQGTYRTAQYCVHRVAERTFEPVAIKFSVCLHVADGWLDCAARPDHRAAAQTQEPQEQFARSSSRLKSSCTAGFTSQSPHKGAGLLRSFGATLRTMRSRPISGLDMRSGTA